MYREFAEVLEALRRPHGHARRVRRSRGSRCPGVTGELVSGAFADPGHVHYVADWQQAADYTATVARDGDYVITLGCGNVYQIIPQVLEALSHTRPAGGAEREPDAPARRRFRAHDSAADAAERPVADRRDADARASRGRPAGADEQTLPRPITRRPVTPPTDAPRRWRPGASRRRRSRPRRTPRCADDRRSGMRDVWRPRAPAARRCAPRSGASPSAAAPSAASGSGSRHPSCSSSSARVGAAYSPLFAVEQITVVGRIDSSTRGAVEAALADQIGTPLPLVDDERGQGRAGGVPAGRVVHARGAAAARPRRADRRADADRRDPDAMPGTRSSMPPASRWRRRPTRRAGQPLARRSRAAPTRTRSRAAGHVMRSLPGSIATQVTGVAATTPDDVTLTLGGADAQVVWGSAEESAKKALVLDEGDDRASARHRSASTTCRRRSRRRPLTPLDAGDSARGMSRHARGAAGARGHRAYLRIKGIAYRAILYTSS